MRAPYAQVFYNSTLRRWLVLRADGAGVDHFVTWRYAFDYAYYTTQTYRRGAR